MNTAILGSGFGLYGYLPALAAERSRILLPERYRAIVESRAELSDFAAGVIWVADDKEAIRLADAVIVARRPIDQSALLAELLSRPNLKRLLLEKPLAPTPAAASRLQDQIETSGKIIRMGYSFGATDWGQKLIAQAVVSCGDLQIRWRFRAHHYTTGQSNWKTLNSQGGGALRFYGIQLIALLAHIGFENVSASSIAATQSDQAESWRASLVNGNGDRCDLELDSNSAQHEFSVQASSFSTSLPDPFAGNAAGLQDRRVPLLAKICREMLTSDQTSHRRYRAAIDLWRSIEDVTVHSGAAKP